MPENKTYRFFRAKKCFTLGNTISILQKSSCITTRATASSQAHCRSPRLSGLVFSCRNTIPRLLLMDEILHHLSVCLVTGTMQMNSQADRIAEWKLGGIFGGCFCRRGGFCGLVLILKHRSAHCRPPLDPRSNNPAELLHHPSVSRLIRTAQMSLRLIRTAQIPLRSPGLNIETPKRIKRLRCFVVDSQY